MSELLVVFGATGQQGRSVIKAVLQDAELKSKYRIRGTTRDPSKAEAQALAAKGVEIVQAEIDDFSSVQKAFQGAQTVFASTVTVYDGHAYKHEVEHGRALADAALAAGVPYYVYSTLPHAGNNSGGELKHMGHFDGKAEVEAYIRTLPMRSAFVAPGCFMSNFHDSLQPRNFGNDIYVLANFVAPQTRLPLIDTAADTGKWVAAILSDFNKYGGQTLSCATRLYSMQEMVDILSKASGKTVVYKQLPREVWEGFLPPTMKDHLSEMFQYFEKFGYFGDKTEDKVEWSAQQAKGTLTTLEQFLAANPLKLA